MLALLAAAALAQQPTDWQFQPGAVLAPNPAIPFMSQSIGSPSVVYDELHDKFWMVFEARTPTTDPRCPQGVWALGLASSPDGITWTPETQPLLEPVPGDGTQFSCVAAHPTAIYDPARNGGNGAIVVWFKAEQDSDACATTTPAWGCGQYTGVGRLIVRTNAAGNVQGVLVGNTLALRSRGRTFGYPKVVRDGATYLLLLGRYPDIWRYSGSTIFGFSGGTNVMEVADYRSAISWVRDEFFNPSLVCDDSFVFPLASFVGGRDTRFGEVISAGWGKAISTTGTSWVLGVQAQQEWFNNDEWRHWDVLKTSGGDYLIWFSEKDANGNNFIRFGGTTLTFANADVQSRLCP